MAKRIILRAINNQFVRQESAAGELRIPPRNQPDTQETFTRTVAGGKITLEPANSTATNRLYLSAEGGGGGLVLARRAPAGDWEKFEEVDRGSGRIALLTHDGSYLCAEGGGGDLLLANRTSAGDWETFDLVDLGEGRIALRSHGGQFVRAEGGGGGRVVVNRDCREAETLIQDDSSFPTRVTFKAANGKYLCAEGGGNGGPVRANRDAVGGDWEKFTVGTNADKTVTLQGNPYHQWVQAENGGGAGLRAGGTSRGDWEKFVRTPWYERPRPRKLLVYYGFPSLINGAAGDRVAAGRTFSHYEYVILGRGIEDSTHDDHAATKEIIANIRWNTAGRTKVFGYLTMDDLGSRVAWWKTLGVDGILLDKFGMDYQTGTRAEKRCRQNDAVDRVHAASLSVIANAWNPDDIWDTSGSLDPSTMLPTDYYFSESYLIKSGAYQDPTEWHTKAEKLRAYQAIHDFRILSATTTEHPFDPAQFEYAWHGAMLYSHEAFAWGEPSFSASGPHSNKADFHPRPAPTPTYFEGDIAGPTGKGTYTRPTDTGMVTLNPIEHTASVR